VEHKVIELATDEKLTELGEASANPKGAKKIAPSSDRSTLS
jgi:hypothetical protein